ncbi:SH3 domain-containing protein [Tricharina praecox]|uniref:SH3 domain-containing protein n=1 Tax=Tricharina praecox TaxID=43433 RepID=UPI00221F3AD4|nr:SH3 domain-containing protein [Tricharina praecox]KAI5849040.1 SH3 domain-containing protein [Tricharina praecox]
MPSLFLGVYKAVYGYTAQNNKEISFDEGDIICVLEKPADDDWWKAKKKGNVVDDEEPVGLVPNNYIEEFEPIAKCKALYDYTPQTEEELAFNEDDVLDVYDTSDPDWVLGGLKGQYGYVPANYVEKGDEASSPADDGAAAAATATAAAAAAAAATSKKHVAFTREREENIPESPSPVQRHAPPPRDEPPSPALPDREPARSPRQEPPRAASPPRQQQREREREHRSEPSYSRDEGRPAARPTANRGGKSPKSPQFVESDDSDGPGLPLRRPGQAPYRHGGDQDNSSHPIPPGFRTYPVMEVDSKKKRAATLGLGPNRIILLPDKSSRPREEWTIDNMTGYNYEGKHVFLDLKHPSRSLDLHAGSTQVAEEIISALGELRGIRKAAGLDEVIAAVNGAKAQDIGTVLYDFPAQGEDEVSVTAGDEVVILDDTNDEWWLVKRQVNGEEGVLPSSYVERGRKNISQTSGIKESPGVRSDSRKSPHIPQGSSSGAGEVKVSGVPVRRSSLAAPSQSRKSAAPGKSKPDTSQIRTWTDRTGSFKVDAQFLGCRDGKIHLHKVNGVKIAVPVSKMSMTDLRYVEDRTGMSLDEDKPLSEIMKEQRRNNAQNEQAGIAVRPNPIATVKSNNQIDYDWFDFFLGCGVDVNNCQRYALSFIKDELDGSSLEDLTSDVMRSLGVKEGDILRIRKKLDERYGRKKDGGNGDGTGAGGLFADGNGNLKTSRTRPPPAVQTGAVDPKALQTQKEKMQAQAQTQGAASNSPPGATSESGFEDEAWSVKPTKAPTAAPAASPSPPQQTQQPAPTAQPPALTGALGELASLSLDTPPLQPTVITPPQTYQQPGINAPVPVSNMMPPMFTGQQNANQLSNFQAGRARPAAPTMSGNNLGIAPPPARPLSAPQSFMTAPAQALTPTFTGAPNQFSYMNPQGQPGGMPQMSFQNTGMMPQQYSQMGFPMQQQTPMPMQVQMTGMPMQPIPQPQMQQMTGMPMQQQQQMTGMPMQQMTGQQPLPPFSMYGGVGSNGALGVNRILPPPLIPQQTAASLRPQPTGPPPPVRFGVQPKKMTPQPTGRANLTKATPENPFGF